MGSSHKQMTPICQRQGTQLRKRGRERKGGQGKGGKRRREGLNTGATISDYSICMEEILTVLPLMLSQVCRVNGSAFNPKDIRDPVVKHSTSLCLAPQITGHLQNMVNNTNVLQIVSWRWAMVFTMRGNTKQ